MTTCSLFSELALEILPVLMSWTKTGQDSGWDEFVNPPPVYVNRLELSVI